MIESGRLVPVLDDWSWIGPPIGGPKSMRGRMNRRPLPGPISSRGVAAVEFGLLLPLLIVIFAGVVEFGLMLYNKALITNAAREAARAGIMLREPRLTKAQIETVAVDYCFTNGSPRLPLTITLMGNSTCTAVATVPLNPTSLEDDLQVEVSYQYQGPISSLVALIAGAPLDLDPMLSRATMKYE